MTDVLKDLPPALVGWGDKLRQLREQGTFLVQNGDTGWASAPSNIALLKYWGKVKGRTQIPSNASLSRPLGSFRSHSRVELVGRFFPVDSSVVPPSPQYLWDCGQGWAEMPEKMARWCRTLLAPFAPEIGVRLTTSNDFPTACGIASSASGYAALAGAMADALGLERHLSPLELDEWLWEWARLGSGSACRSAFRKGAGWMVWEPHEGSSRCREASLHPKFESLKSLVVVVSSKEKETSSSDGHGLVPTSPLGGIRKNGIAPSLKLMEKALEKGQVDIVGWLTEQDAFAMHAVMLTCTPTISYLKPETVALIESFVEKRNQSQKEAFWTLDAGPNPHILYTPESEDFVESFLTEFLKTHPHVRVLRDHGGPGLVMGQKKATAP